MPDFVFATCLPGIERALKLDVAHRRPELRFSYSRPGLVTFKSSRSVRPEDLPGSAFARVWGCSLGALRTPADAARILAPLGVRRVHIFARDPEQSADLVPWRHELAAVAPLGIASPGELVADVIVAHGEPAWGGLHRADSNHLPVPGGDFEVAMPSESPSRAFAKIEEVIRWAELPVREGDVAVELGSAPGGAALALAMRGVTVFGVDPAAMDPGVLAYEGPSGARVHHLATKVSALRWESLPERVDWLVSDMNLAPQVVVHELSRLLPAIRPGLRGAVLTLKLNDWSFVSELPMLAKRLEALGLAPLRMRHLAAHRREIGAVAVLGS
jgi:23S rRNA (cytidine2498-2'-O)-methyltransferase